MIGIGKLGVRNLSEALVSVKEACKKGQLDQHCTDQCNEIRSTEDFWMCEKVGDNNKIMPHTAE